MRTRALTSSTRVRSLSREAAFAPRVDPDREDALAERLLARLQALASPVRLRLLNALVVPTRAPDLKVPAARERTGFERQRFLGRSTIIEHLEVLEKAGLVRRVGEQYVVDQQGMVVFLQDVSDLAKLRALIEVDVESTRPSRAISADALPPAPRVVIVGGPQAGRAFALAGRGPWEIGRAPTCDIALSHDPHVSRLHVSITQASTGHEARVVEAAKNAAWVDFARLEPGSSCPIRSGSILSVGATTLVLQS